MENVEYVADKLPRRGPWPRRAVQGITDITIHHTAASEKTCAQIARAHLGRHKESGKSKTSPWPGIAYHFVVFADGTAYQTQPLWAWSYHNGYNNKVAVAVTMAGNFELAPPTLEQLEATMVICEGLKALLPGLRHCMGHREYEGATLCPGKHIDMTAFRQRLGLGLHPRARRPDRSPA
jgi:hypothetical protein